MPATAARAALIKEPFRRATSTTTATQTRHGALARESADPVPTFFDNVADAQVIADARGIKFGSSETIYTGSAGFTVSGSTMYRKRYLFQQEIRIWETDDDLGFTTYDTVVLVVDGAVL